MDSTALYILLRADGHEQDDILAAFEAIGLDMSDEDVVHPLSETQVLGIEAHLKSILTS